MGRPRGGPSAELLVWESQSTWTGSLTPLGYRPPQHSLLCCPDAAHPLGGLRPLPTSERSAIFAQAGHLEFFFATAVPCGW